MKLTIKSDEYSTSKSMDLLKIKTTDASLRTFGLKLVYGATSLERLGYAVNFYLDDGPGRSYKTPMFIETRFLSKLIKAQIADKECECGNLILCTCHEKCEVCEGCEAGRKTAGVAMRLASKVLNAAAVLNESYDDKEENKARDAWESDE